jgi:hypothetical protein
MSSEAQIKANQQNSQKSTGPRTPRGKAVVSLNALKPGLFGSTVLVTGENQADFDRFSGEMLSELAPVGAVESMLAERVVGLSWRLQRIERMQNQAIDVMIARDEPSPLTKHVRASLPRFLRDLEEDPRGSGPELVLGRAGIQDFTNYKVLGQLSLYERRIESSMLKTMNELERRQLMRQLQEEKAAEPQFAPESCPPGEKQVNLKEQSQFAPAHTGAKSFAKEGYENRGRRKTGKNKAKQSQFQGSPKGAGRRKVSREALSGSA